VLPAAVPDDDDDELAAAKNVWSTSCNRLSNYGNEWATRLAYNISVKTHVAPCCRHIVRNGG
jgi:hypothetical protein